VSIQNQIAGDWGRITEIDILRFAPG